jgi:hypothetical protein
MTHRLITAEEARALREAATPGPWGVRHKPHGWDFCLVAAAPDLAATVEALHAEVERLRAQNGELRSALQDYLDNDDTNEGGKWEESNAPWLAIKRRATALLSSIESTP